MFVLALKNGINSQYTVEVLWGEAKFIILLMLLNISVSCLPYPFISLSYFIMKIDIGFTILVEQSVLAYGY